MLEAAELSKVAAEALLTVNKKKADIKVEQQVAVLMNAIKEATTQLNFDEERMFVAIEKEQKRREGDL